MRIGYFPSREEYSPKQLVAQAVAAEAAGYENSPGCGRCRTGPHTRLRARNDGYRPSMADHPQSRTHEPQTLRYRVPDRQDPVVVLSALTHAGLTAGRETVDGDQYVIVVCPDSRERDRERIRDVISRRADKTSLEGPHFDRQVVFDDEA